MKRARDAAQLVAAGAALAFIVFLLACRLAWNELSAA